MDRYNPLKHIVGIIDQHEDYDRTAVLAELNLSEAAFAKKLAKPSVTFVQQFIRATGTTVSVKVQPKRPLGGSISIGLAL